LGLGFGLGAALAYDSYYPGYWGYGYPAYWGYPAGYAYDAGYTDPWAYDYGTSYAAPVYGAPAPSAAAPPAASSSGQNCGKWVWHADENQYRFETHAC
jgi:hypothetical protein